MVYSKGYGKKPWWFWLIVYVIIGGILYYGIYYFALARNGSNPYQNKGSSPYNYGK